MTEFTAAESILGGSLTRDGMRRLFPVLGWARRYNRVQFVSDAGAAMIVTIMLVPQSLAYAMLAGLPPEVGLYASILPLIAYSIFGTSSTLAVGPVAVVSLMTAAALSRVVEQGTDAHLMAAATLALITGLILTLMGLLRLGFVANFLSHPVIAGFVTASGLLIATSQIGPLFGIDIDGHTAPEMLVSLASGLGGISPWTFLVGGLSLLLLLWIRYGLAALLTRLRLPDRATRLLVRAGPLLVVALMTISAALLDLGGSGVALVGAVPQGLPALAVPSWDWRLVRDLAVPALVISLVGFVESVSIAQTLAAKRRERIDPNQELIALGAANLGAGIAGGYPVTGGFARSVVNSDAGAATPAAGAFAAIGTLLATLLLTQFIAHLPKATLAATIVVAVLSLIDFSVFRKSWRYSRADFAAVAITLIGTLLLGVELGIALGVTSSVLLFLYRSSNPHVAIVGEVPGTEHFRNIMRHQVETEPDLLSMRVDESLYFANARYLEDVVLAEAAARPDLKHVILMCPAVNSIDMSALESLAEINRRLKEIGVGFHLSEVKGPVMDRLVPTEFLRDLNGKVFLSQHQAIEALRQRSAA